MFRLCSRALHTASHMDYSKFLTRESLQRQPSAIRALQPLLNIPGMISLGGGFSIQLKDGERVEVGEADTKIALQYSATNGLPGLVAFLKDLQLKEHTPKAYQTANDFDVCVMNGSQDGIAKAFDMLISPGDSVIVESPIYSGSLAILKPMDCTLLEVATDEFGIKPERLRDVLEAAKSQQKRLKFIYTVPTASNPTGVTTTAERKKEIYALAQEFDLLILEDDPFNQNRAPSYFSMDSDGRVLRFDSFSKVLSSGMRIGWVTGPKPLLERIILHSQVTNLHPNGLSQVFALKLMEKWGFEGFQEHVRVVADFYQARRDCLVRLARQYLGDLVEFNVPSGGMFLWMRVKGTDDARELIKGAVAQKVLFLPGFEFMPNGQKSSYIRASFSTATPDQMEEAMRRLKNLLCNQ